MATMTLTEFLLARIAEDESAAEAAAVRNGATWTARDLNHSGWRVSGTTKIGNPHSYGDENDALWDDEGAMGMWPETAAHVVTHDPARVLAECEAKRRIVERSTWVADRKRVPTDRPGVYDMVDVVVVNEDAEDTLRILASVYADHPDYREEWRP